MLVWKKLRASKNKYIKLNFGKTPRMFTTTAYGRGHSHLTIAHVKNQLPNKNTQFGNIQNCIASASKTKQMRLLCLESSHIKPLMRRNSTPAVPQSAPPSLPAWPYWDSQQGQAHQWSGKYSQLAILSLRPANPSSIRSSLQSGCVTMTTKDLISPPIGRDLLVLKRGHWTTGGRWDVMCSCSLEVLK